MRPPLHSAFVLPSRMTPASRRTAQAVSAWVFSKNGLVALLLLIVVYQNLISSSSSKAASNSLAGLEVDDGLEVEPPVRTSARAAVGDSITGGAKMAEDENVYQVDDYGSSSSANESDESSSSPAGVSKSKSSFTKGYVTIVTGTHLSKRALAVDERTQHASCGKLAYALHLMWSAWEVKTYGRAKSAVKEALKQVANARASCILSGSRKHNMLWTFPMSWRPDANCDARMTNVLTSGSYLREKTKIYVNWFLLRPDLVTFNNMASVESVEVHFAISVAPEFHSAAFSEEKCPRFNTILDKRDVYKQRLLLVALSDIEHQLQRMRRPVSHIYVCDGSGVKRSSQQEAEFAALLGSNSFSVGQEGCQIAPPISREAADNTHVGSMLRMAVFSHLHTPSQVVKTVFTGPKLVFVAGLEGVGHHVFSILGRRHTTRPLYDALTEHLCDSAWDDNSLEKYGPARERFVRAIRQVKDSPSSLHKDGSNVIFLNTVWVKGDVNMYSYPWGGPRCFLKRYARVMCNIDLIELTRIAEEAGIDFRVILLKRSIGAAVVSASLHRPFGTLVSETRMLALSWALLKSGVDAIDRRFTVEINYEDMINHPAESTAKLAEHLGFDKSNSLYAHFEQTLTQSGIDHPVGDGSRWKEEVDLDQLQFMSDLLGL